MKIRSSVSMVAVSVVVATSTFLSSSAEATTWWQRIPANNCQAFQGATSYAQSITGPGGGPAGAAITGNSSGFSAICPFVDSNSTPDNGVTAIDIDMFNPTSSAIPVDQAYAEACVFSSWAVTCGSTTSNPAISADGHGTLAISDLSAWTNDSGNGYAYVVLESSSSTKTTWFAGMYIHN
jgi:hypothetical protein